MPITALKGFGMQLAGSFFSAATLTKNVRDIPQSDMFWATMKF